MNIDFSRYHPYGHVPFGRFCRTQYGGGRRHIKLLWEYRIRPRIRTWSTCRVGRHVPAVASRRTWGWQGEVVEWDCCRYCAARLSPDRPASPQTILRWK